MVSSFFSLVASLSAKFGYLGIVFLMAVESSFIPFPSEIVIPPAAYLASQGELNVFAVFLCGVLGSLLGASVNYWLAISLGRKAVYYLVEKKFFRLLLLDRNKLEKAENYFLKYGRSSTFFGRLVPAVRQLISIPAGFSKMPFLSFLAYTALGSGLWVAVLTFLGYYFGENKELFARYYEELKYGLLLLFVLSLMAIVFYNRRKKPRQRTES